MTGPEKFQAVAIICAAVVSLVGAYISIRSRKSQTRQVEANTSLTETQQSEIVQRLAESTEEMYLKRIESFKDDIGLLRRELTSLRAELDATRDEAGLFEDFFFNHHQPWDRKAAIEIQATNPEFPNPPSWLIFLREKGRNTS